MVSRRLIPALAILVVVAAAGVAVAYFAGASDGSDENGPSEQTSVAGEPRCEQLGYPCTWNEAGVEAFDRTVELATELQLAVDDASDPRSGLQAAVEILKRRDDVVEVKVDDALWTGMMFRLEGAPPGFVETILASLIPAPEGLERIPVPELPSSSASRTPIGSASSNTPIRFHPTGGPLQDRSAAILDPYHTADRGCEVDLVDTIFGKRDECRRTADGGLEGDFIRQIFESEEQYTEVVHYRDSDVTPATIAGLERFDAIHILSHSSTACSDWDPAFGYAAQPGECVTQIALGPLGPGVRAAIDAGSEVVSAGFAASSTRWWMISSELANLSLGDSIVFVNSCTSIDGALGQAQFGGIVGWHGYALQRSATDAALKFWELMVIEGVEFDVAYDELRELGLYRSEPANINEYLGITAQATLQAGGKNYRARDVVTAWQDLEDKLLPEDRIRTVGEVEDGVNDEFDERFLLSIDGVKEGTASSTVVEIIIDGKSVRKLKLEERGTAASSSARWSRWFLPLEGVDIGFDLTDEDVAASNPRPHQFEVRVYVDSDRFSAFEADPVYFGGLRGVCPIVKANSGRLSGSFGAEVPFEKYVEITRDYCQFDFKGEAPHPQEDFSAEISPSLIFEQQPPIVTTVDFAIRGVDNGSPEPAPSLGDQAVSIFHPFGDDVSVYFEHGGRIYQVQGSNGWGYLKATSPADVIAVAEVLLELLGGPPAPDPKPEPTSAPQASLPTTSDRTHGVL